jgi:translocation and assembly module TamB
MRLFCLQRPSGTSDEARRRRRWRQWVRRTVATAVGLVALVAAALLVLLHSLDQPWLKGRLLRLARTALGAEIDYHTARIELLSGAEIEGLVVQSPAEFRPFAPDLVRVGRVGAQWSLTSLLLGRGPLLRRVAVSDVTLTVVVDEHGRTSFDALSSSASGPTVPLSRQASKVLGTAPPVGRLDVDRVALAVVQTAHKAVSDRTELRGVSGTLTTSSAEPTTRGWRVQGSAQANGARARLWARVDATSTALTATLDLQMMEQTFAASVPANHWLHAESSVRFDPTAGWTDVTLDHTEAADGAATVQASIRISDAGDLIVRRAQGDIDLARLLQWVPAGLVPVTAERARVRYQVDSLVAGAVVHLSEGGAVVVDADLSNVVSSGLGGPVQIGAGELSLRVAPAEGGGLAGRGSIKVTGARVAWRQAGLAAADLAVDFDGQQDANGFVDGRVGVRFARVELEGASSAVARDGHVELRVQGLHPAPAELLATQGDLALSAELPSLDMRSPRMHAIVDGLKLGAHSTLEGHAPYAVELDAPVSRLRVFEHDGNVVVDGPARVQGRVRDVQLDIAHPAASRGVALVAVELGDVQASLEATKGADLVDFALHATARSLVALRPYLPRALIDKAPWDRIAVTVRSSGHVEHFAAGSPAIRQATEVDVERPAFANVAAQFCAVTVKSEGTSHQHQAEVDLRAKGLTFDGDSPSDDHVMLSATVDRDRRLLRFQIATEGRAATKLSASVSFDPVRRALPYDMDGRVAGLAPLAPLIKRVRGLDAFDLSELEIGLSARGALLGVVAAVARDGTIQLEPSPVHTAAVEGEANLRVDHFRWAKGNAAIATPAMAWHGEMRAFGPRRTLDSRVEVGTLHLDFGSHDFDLNGIRDETSAAVIGSLADPEIELTQHLSVRAVEQTAVPEYSLGDLAFALSAERSPEGVVHISDLKLANGVGGTALSVAGNIDLSEGRRTISVTTLLTQDLARLSRIPERFTGRGRVAAEATITSPDLAHYHVRGVVKGENVTIALSRAGVHVETANGEVPVTVTLEVGANGVAFGRSGKRSPYSMLRFADQHPLLSRSGFLSIARLKTPFASIAPLVGNLEIEQNVVSLRQFEMGIRGGTVTGQCGIDWDGPKSTLELHVRASGVQSSHGEPFDGNIAVAISAADRTIDGRAEILRIGERHLLDLLDMQDPMHVDPAMNRIRTALAFGYPDSVRLAFDHGFASAHLELGGLARLISIAELRGIPMGPIVDKMLAPVLDRPDTKETP